MNDTDHVAKANIAGNPNIGMFAFVTDKYALVGSSASDAEIELMKAVLKVPVHQLNVCGTSLIGVFVGGNEKFLLVPTLIFPEELKKLRVVEQYGTKIILVNTKFTALGNITILKDDVLLANSEIEDKALDQIAKETGAKTVKRIEIADTDVIGSTMLFTQKGGLIHPDIDNDMLTEIEALLNITFTLGTVNWGSPFVRAGVLANAHGFLIGHISSGPEVANTDEALGFVDSDSL